LVTVHGPVVIDVIEFKYVLVALVTANTATSVSLQEYLSLFLVVRLPFASARFTQRVLRRWRITASDTKAILSEACASQGGDECSLTTTEIAVLAWDRWLVTTYRAEPRHH
jgi:hypothetical protein